MNFLKTNKGYIAIGALAGLVNGLLGAGGGIIITWYLSKKLECENRNDVFANAVATMLPISVLSIILYFTKGYIILNSEFYSLLLPALVGGTLGAYLLTKIKFKLVKILFAVLVVISGFSMIG